MGESRNVGIFLSDSILLRVLKTFKCRSNLFPYSRFISTLVFVMVVLSVCTGLLSLSGEVDETLNVLFRMVLWNKVASSFAQPCFIHSSCTPEYKNLPFL